MIERMWGLCDQTIANKDVYLELFGKCGLGMLDLLDPTSSMGLPSVEMVAANCAAPDAHPLYRKGYK
jgi:hypothetical protein